jgi:hypothetical protein
MTSFLVRNCSSLLDFALSESDMDLGRKSFFLLSKKVSSKVVHALLEADLFFVKATEVLSGQSVSSLIISRLSALLNAIVVKQKSCYTETIGFLFQLLRFIDDPSVFSLFSAICGVADNMAELQLGLSRTNFATLVLREFEGNYVPDEKLANLCALVNVCLNNRILAANFTGERFIAAFAGLLSRDDLLLRNQLWAAVVSLCGGSTWHRMSEFQSCALEILQPTFTDLHMYHVCACDFVGKYL